jgi:hypothetical protein
MVPRDAVGPRSFGFRSVLRSTLIRGAASVVAAVLFASATANAQPTDPNPGPGRTPTAPPTAQPAPSPAPAGDPSRDDLIPPEPVAPTDTGPPVDPSKDQQKLVQQGRERPTADGTIGSRPTDVYSEDWWAHTRPILELHGYFRTRGELFHNFSLSRHDAAGQGSQNLWQHPLDNTFTDRNGQRRQVLLCKDPNPAGQYSECFDKSEAHANLRLRLNPEIHISDNLRILSQVDLLDNLVLGSTPDSYAMRPSGVGATGYSPAVNGYNGYSPLGAFSNTQGPPTAVVNGYSNSIDVQRAWA